MEKTQLLSRKKGYIFYVGVLTIFIVTIFGVFFSYINEPIGDDILCYFDGAFTFYCDEFENTLGNKITSPPQIVEILKFVYTHWSGRMTGYTIEFIGKLFPKFVQAVLISSVFTANVFLALRIVFKESRKVIESPLAFVVLWTALYWFRPDTYYTYMWTMASIYSFAVFFLLLYYNFSVVDEKKGISHKIWVMQIIGFLAGFSHEVISLCIIAAIGVIWLIDVVSKKKNWTSIFHHTGLGIGYLLCFFAPGNFYRSKQSQEVVKSSFVERLIASWDTHITILDGTQGAQIVFILVFLLAYAAFAILLRKRNKDTLLKIVNQCAGFLAGGIISIVIWSFSPRVPAYGMDIWIICVYIIFFCFIRELPLKIYFIKNEWIRIVAPVLIIVIFALTSSKEIESDYKTSQARHNAVHQAQEAGKYSVVVPRFSNDLSSDRYLLGYLNGQRQYDTYYYRAYYGKRLVIEAE